MTIVNRTGWKRMKKGLKGWKAALPFILPGLILVSVFILYPMIFTIRISLSDYRIVTGEITFVGFDNYKAILFDSKDFWYAYRNNFLYAFFTVPMIIFGGLVFAYLIDNLLHGKTIFKVGFYLPVITSWVIVSLVFRYMFSNGNTGLVNYLLVDVFSVMDDYVPWLYREWTGNAAIWLMGIWKNVGWSMLIFLAALQTIPVDLYESASIDGAGLWQKFRHITIKSIKPTILFVMVNMIIGAFNVFIQVLLLTGGDPNNKTTVLQYLLYNRAFNKFEFGEASAIGLLSAFTIVILTVFLNKLLKLDTKESGDDR